MQSDEARYPAPSGRFFLLLLLMGGLVGLALLLLGAPFWAFYIAPVLMAPLVIWELKAVDLEKPSSSEMLVQSYFARILDQAKTRFRENWLVAGLGVLWALVATVSFLRDARLVGGLAAGASGALLVYVVWQLSRTKTLLDATESERIEFLLHFADRQMELPEISVVVVEIEDSWLLVPEDRPEEEDLLKFRTEDEARAAADEYVAEHGGEVFTFVLDQAFKRELIHLRAEEENTEQT